MQLPLSILMYRQVRRAPDPLFPDDVDARRLEQHLRLLTRWFRILPLDEAVRRLRERSLSGPTACLTFEHGYAEHAQVVLPLLVRFNVSATFFVASGYLDGGCMWPDAVSQVLRDAPGDRLNLARSGFGSYDIASISQRRAVLHMLLSVLRQMPHEERILRVQSMARQPHPTMLSSDELLALHRAGMAIGAQTVGAPALSSISNAQARTEIADGRAVLQRIIQAPVRHFAYPGGIPGEDFEPRHTNMLRSQAFEGALTSAAGAARPDSDPFLLPRFTPSDFSPARFLLRMAGKQFKTPA
jgi:peptidoglycan/xylan/chitin deacetylase (PgdA/CDA1 family)